MYTQHDESYLLHYLAHLNPKRLFNLNNPVQLKDSSYVCGSSGPLLE